MLASPKSKYATAINNEQLISSYIPYSSHITPETIATQDSALLRTFKLEGMTFETKDDFELNTLHIRLNSWVKSLAEDNIAVWTHTVRRKHISSLDGSYQSAFCQQLDKKYNEKFNSETYINELYLTIVYRPPKQLGKRLIDIAAAKLRLQTSIEVLAKYAESALSSFQSYGIRSLSCYTSARDNYCSEPLEFLNFLLTGVWQGVRVPSGTIANYIGNAWLDMGKQTIELRNSETIRYAQGVDIKEYCKRTTSGMLNQLLYVDFEFVLTQSFSLHSKKTALGLLKTTERQLSNAGDDAISQIQDLTNAKNELQNGDFAMGEYHFTLLVFDDSPQVVKLHRAKVQKILSDLEILSSQITIALDAAFYAQLPANWQYRPRVANLTSRNFAALSPFWNFMNGKPVGNPWGNAVTRLSTLAGHPFYFNFHYTRPGDDNFGDKVAGNTRIIGMTGTGKTAAIALLYCQAQKYAENSPFSTVFFDKDRGAEVLIRAIGGTYLRVKDGEPTGFNPFQMEPTNGNITFLKQLVRQLVTRESSELTVQEEDSISRAVNTVMTMPKELRRLSLINQNISVGITKEEQENSIKRRLARWCHGGEFGWVFDNPTDELNFNVTPNIGIDGTEFLNNKDVKTPISMYLLHRMEDIIDGRRFMYIMDEAWAWVDDPAFSEFAGNKQFTIRKQNGLGVFLTQQPSSLLDSKIGAALAQGCSTEIYLPNPKGKRKEYVEGFGLTNKEFDLLMACDEKSRLCLIKQGSNSTFCSLSMNNMRDELSIMSAGTDDLVHLDEAIAEMGEAPENWIPVYLSKRKAAQEKSR